MEDLFKHGRLCITIITVLSSNIVENGTEVMKKGEDIETCLNH